MHADAFEAYRRAAVAGYAKDNVEAGRWLQADALALSEADFQSSLPQGVATPDNYLYEIKVSSNGPCAGVLWFAVEVRQGARCAYVYDVEVYAPWQRQGYAQGAFRALEPIVAALGLSSIRLHVFSHNPGAQALYAKLGYGVTGLNMIKQLD